MESQNKPRHLEDLLPKSNFTEFKQGIQNYLIDTSAKVVSYAPIMAAMEACNGLDKDQIIHSRLSASLIDSFVARIYGKTLDFVRKELGANPEEKSIKNYLIDTGTMIGVYTPVYAGILYSAGAEHSQVAGALTMGAAIAAVTARPFAKYILGSWRNICGYKK